MSAEARSAKADHTLIVKSFGWQAT